MNINEWVNNLTSKILSTINFQFQFDITSYIELKVNKGVRC